MNAVTEARKFAIPQLNAGEIYGGLILGKNGEPDYHLILLPGQATDVSWQQAKEFAAKSGGELPTRREQALLFANLKEQFEERAYWSNTQHASYSAFAWYQDFCGGSQNYDGTTDGKLRARAVCRSMI